ncbi:MAG TPA: type II secretion system F family protein [Spirochaetota bacterium]|nr:type II secretion system F family protein [Spirochaetota bacterium]
MKKYSAIVFNEQGKKRRIVEEAISRHLFENSLHKRGYFIVEINDYDKGRNVQLFDNKISKKFIIDFTNNIYSLLDFGIDINEAVRISLEIYSTGKENKFISEINNKLKKGEKLSASLKSSGEDFDDFYITMVASGEASGKLNESFKLIYQYLKNNSKIKEKIISASLYPSILLFVSFCAINLLFFVIIPNFSSIYKNMDFTPSLFIGLMFSVSKLLSDYFMLYLSFIVIIIILLIYFIRSKSFYSIRTKLFKTLPVLSKIYKLQSKIKISFSIEILLKGGLTLEDALVKLKDIENREDIKNDYITSVSSLKEGKSVSDAFRSISYFDKKDINIIKISEAISKTKEGFEKIRNEAENRFDSFIDRIFKLIEPVMMIFIGIFIFFIMYLVMSPTLNMIDKF